MDVLLCPIHSLIYQSGLLSIFRLFFYDLSDESLKIWCYSLEKGMIKENKGMGSASFRTGVVLSGERLKAGGSRSRESGNVWR